MISRKTVWRIGLLLSPAAGLTLILGCGADKSPIEPVAEENHFLAKFEIHPPAFARTESTKDRWTEEIVLDIPIDLEEHEGGHHKVIAERLAAFDTTIHGMKIEFEHEEGKYMKLFDHGNWMEHQADQDQRHLVLTLADPTLDAHASNLVHCDVTMTITRNGIVVASGVLEPMYGGHGFHYGGNFALPEAGDYEITVKTGIPEFARGEAVKDKWMHEEELTFHYSYSGAPPAEEVGIGEVEEHGMKIELEAEAPKRMHVKMNGTWTWMEPEAGATHHFDAKLEDPAVEAHHEPIGYFEVHVTIVNQTTGEKTEELELQPMYSDHGFHYGANVHLPDGHNH